MICSVTSTCIKLVRYTERGRELDRAARQIVQRIEEDRACRLGEQKMDLLRELIAELEKDQGTSG
jgi:DNA-binding MarR family transcriptional regulator